MLLKEYRVCMPLTVEEYRIGQLYMIARHSAEESRGEGDGVEVMINEPCHDDVHGDGQYTEKRIYLTSRMPAWVQYMIPKVFYIIEKAWNHYPYTRTEYTCSFVPKFSIEVETVYQNNNGSSENALELSQDLLSVREVDFVDIATDHFSNGETPGDLDCTGFKSQKTGRGPLQAGWRDSCVPIMCSYKMTKAFFEVWGLQGKVETGVHKAIKDVLLRGHKQAFLWIDEWHGMSIKDVREYELKMQSDTNSRVLDGVELEASGTS